jgi:hypothetical protein
MSIRYSAMVQHSPWDHSHVEDHLDVRRITCLLRLRTNIERNSYRLSNSRSQDLNEPRAKHRSMPVMFAMHSDHCQTQPYCDEINLEHSRTMYWDYAWTRSMPSTMTRETSSTTTDNRSVHSSVDLLVRLCHRTNDIDYMRIDSLPSLNPHVSFDRFQAFLVTHRTDQFCSSKALNTHVTPNNL